MTLHRMIHQLLEIAITELIDDIDIRFADENFADFDDVLVIESLQCLDFSNELLRNSILCLAYFNFLQGDNMV